METASFPHPFLHDGIVDVIILIHEELALALCLGHLGQVRAHEEFALKFKGYRIKWMSSNVTLNNWTPITAKRNWSSKVTTTMLPMVFTETIKHCTTFFKPFALLMALKGLNTRSTRRILRKPIPLPPKIEIRETDTTTISRQLKGDLAKAPWWNKKPYVISFKEHSIVKIVVNT